MFKKILTYSLLTTIILSLIGLVWHNLTAQVDANAKEIKVVKEKKVDNKTMQQQLKNQERINEMRYKQQCERQEKVDKHLDRLYEQLLKQGK